MWSYVVILLGVVTTGLFASSFNRNSLHALLMTGVLISVGALAIRTAFSAGTFAVWDGLDLNAFYYRVATSDAPSEALLGKTWTAADNLWTDRITLLTVVVGAGGFPGLLLAMGHRIIAPLRLLERSWPARSRVCSRTQSSAAWW